MHGDGDLAGGGADHANVMLVAEVGVRAQLEVAAVLALEMPQNVAFLVEGDSGAQVAERGDVAVAELGRLR